MVVATSKIRTYKQPKTTKFEFLGSHVFGSFFTIATLPIVVIGLFLSCDENTCSAWPLDFSLLQEKLNVQFFHPVSFEVYTAWMIFHFFLAVILPGPIVKGVPLPTPSADRLDYKINGLLSMIVSVAMVGCLCLVNGLAPLLWVADHYFQLAVSGIIFSSFLALFLYMFSYRSSDVVVALGGNSGYPLYDFWMGRELNPRIFFDLVDLKFVCELRPGLIGWLIINLSFAAKQYSTNQRLCNGMILTLLGQGYYVLDALVNEVAILTTMDIASDGFGFMLAFGDLCWVPFTYTIQARYLSIFPQDLSLPFLVAVLSLNFFGLYVFRSSNSEKNAFRSNPNDPIVAHLSYIKTESGSKLLTSGWWGLARKINYTGILSLFILGDWLMSVAWCLPCGFASIIPYFYCIYFAILLFHRAGRDDEMCHHKYGKDWEKYKKLVPYKFIPGLF
jgi:hypothetical protein